MTPSVIRGQSPASCANRAANICGVILAGGLSTRMQGQEKTLLDLGGKPLISFVVARLQPQVAYLAINANGDPTRFAGLGLPTIADKSPLNAGPLAGILVAMKWAKDKGYEDVVTVAGDTPFFPEDLVRRLGAEMRQSRKKVVVAASRTTGKGLTCHPPFGLWSVDLIDDLHQALLSGMRTVIAWVERQEFTTVVFDSATHDPFFNINDPDDLAMANILVRNMQRYD